MLKSMFAAVKNFAVKAWKTVKSNVDVILMSFGF